jgi:3-methyladenine DNA glycosylase/8-oxoguanine DNA glycosylase
MRVPRPFELALVVQSHGWYDLAPWRWDQARGVLARPLRLSSGRLVRAELAEGPGGLLVRAMAVGRPSAVESAEVRTLLATCLALDEDLGPFHDLARALEVRRADGRGADLPDLRWAVERGAGRLLRSPTVFEDAVKTLCTTNCTWAATRLMVARLCETMGEPVPGEADQRAFPTPEAMAAAPERRYREAIRAGYRGPYLRALARSVASGRLDLEALRDPALPTPELLARLLALDGFGPYAAQHLARLLGRHDFLALDAWTRQKLRTLRGRRRQPTDRAIRRWYAPYGRWAGLAMWLEVTADWFAGPSHEA